MPGNAWQTHEVATSVTSYAVAGDPTCGLHTVYSEMPEGRLWHSVERAGGDRRTLVALGGLVGSRGLAIDGAVAHVAYLDDGLRYARGEGDTWSTEAVDPNGHFAAIAVDPEGVPHLLYSAGEPSELRHASRGVDGWSIETVDSRQSFETVLRIARDGTLHASYQWVTSPSTHSIAYASRAARGGAWALEDMETLDGLETGSSSALVVAGGAAHLFYAAYRPAGGQGLRHGTAGGGRFTFEWIDDVSSSGIETGAATLGPRGAIHVVYLDGDRTLTWAHGAPGSLALESLASVAPPEAAGALVAVDGADVVHVVLFHAGRLVQLRRAAP